MEYLSISQHTLALSVTFRAVHLADQLMTGLEINNATSLARALLRSRSKATLSIEGTRTLNLCRGSHRLAGPSSTRW